jgi:hypothetical protein
MTFLSNCIDIEPTVKDTGVSSPITKTQDILRMFSLFFDIDDSDIYIPEWQQHTLIEISFLNEDIINGSFIEMMRQSAPLFFYITRYTHLRFRLPPTQIRFYTHACAPLKLTKSWTSFQGGGDKKWWKNSTLQNRWIKHQKK